MPYRLLDDTNILGMVKDTSPWLLKPGVLADAQNLIFDKPGVARHRGGSTAIFSGAQTAFAQMLGWSYWTDKTVIETLYSYESKTGKVNFVNASTGALTLILTIAPTLTAQLGRSIRHFGFVFFPEGVDRTAIYVAGQQSATSFTNTANAAIVANSGTITLGGADVTTNIKVGGVITAFSASQIYYGRVVSITDATHFVVWPTPQVSITATSLTSKPGLNMYAGMCGCSWQGRLLVGNTLDLALGTPSAGAVSDRRIYYSPLLTETSGGTSTTVQAATGAAFIDSTAWPKLNYLDIPGSDPIIGMEPVSDNELLVLTSGNPWVVRGQLASQTTTFAPGITFDISPINLNADCLADVSIQRTPAGIIWAGTEGIWIYGGGGKQSSAAAWRLPVDITEGAIHTYWRNLTRGSSFAIHGSTQTRNHYVLTGTSGGTTFCLVYNFDNGTWTTFSGIDIYYGAPRPSDPSQNFAARWWDVSGAAPSFTNGGVVRLESLFAPYVAASTKRDADGSAVPFSLTTRSMTDDLQSQKIVRRVNCRYQLQAATAAATVVGGTRIDSGDTAGTPTASLGSLSNTGVTTITAASNATPIVVTAANHGLQSGDAVDIHGVVGNTAANGRWRVIVLSTSTFSLDQSKGNAAYVSGGSVKKVTEQEFEASALDIGQSLYLTVASSGTVDNFEWHGCRAGVMEMPLGMGR